jgi:hypothetical protein
MRDGRSLWVHAASLFAILIAVYTASFNGTTRVDDEHILAARTQSLALSGRLESPQVYGNDRFRDLQPMGDQATQVEPMQALLAAPLYRLGSSLGWGGRQTAFTLNMYATAAAALFLFLAIRELGFKLSTGWVVALGFGLATTAFPYALTFYRDSLAMGFASLVLLGASLQSTRIRRLRWTGAGLVAIGFAFGVLTKNSIVALAPALLIGFGPAVVRFVRHARTSVGWLPAAIVGLVLVAASAWIPSSGPLSRFSWDYYGRLAAYFMGSIRPSLLLGLLGPWLSPAKSVFLFAPPLLLVLAVRKGRGIGLTAQLARTVISFAILLTLGQSLFYRQDWFGGFGWGLRYMLPALPGLMLLTAPVVERALAAGRRSRWLLALPLAVGFVVQLAAAWTPWQPVYQAWLAAGLDPYGPAAAWDPRLLAIPAQVGLALQPGRWDGGWLRLLASGQAGALWIPGSAALVLAYGLLARARASGGHPSRLSGGLAVLAFAGALVLPVFPAMALLRSDPGLAADRASFQRASSWLEASVGDGDVLVVDSYGTPLWTFMSNRWSAPYQWYSLPFELPNVSESAGSGSPPSPPTTALFEEILRSGGRFWYITTPEAPDAGLGREVAWLGDHATIGGMAVFEGPVPVSVYEVSP